MTDLTICIPTRSRAGRVRTLAMLDPRDVWLMVDPDQRDAYLTAHPDANIATMRPYADGIAAKRHWILANSGRLGDTPYVLMLDDDLEFSVRRDGKLVPAFPGDLTLAMLRARAWLDEGMAAVGWSQRAGNNQVPEPYADCTRMMNAYAFNVPLCLGTGARFDRLTHSMEDFDFTLQLLEAGLTNRVDYEIAVGQDDPNAPGGCSDWITADVQRASAERLAALHPGIVTLREHKETKMGWHGLKDRVDVEIAWKKAYRERHQTLLL